MRFCAALVVVLLVLGLLSARAQQDADDQYLVIYSLIQQADGLAGSGQPQPALTQYAEVQNELQKFQKIFPDWNPRIVNFRLKYLAERIADVTAQFPATNAPVQTVTVTNLGPAPAVVTARSDAELAALHGQLQQLQADYTTLAAKLKEALAVQPAAIDSRELVKAQEQIRSLMKENELLKTSLSQGRTRTNIITIAVESDASKQAQAVLLEANQKLSEQVERADKLALENLALQSRVQTLLTSPDDLEALRAENALLKKQIAELKLAALNSPETAELAAELKQARLQIALLQSEVQVSRLEKTALEDRLRKSQAAVVAIQPVPVPAVSPAPDQSKNEERIRKLTQERDDLLARLGAANQELHMRKAQSVATQIGKLTDEILTLRGRLAVDEAQPVPYTPEELALFKSSPPPPASPVARQNNMSELPAGSGELVAQAQSFFVARQYDRAETNYLHILQQDENNALVLGNLAAIEMEEGKLDAAEKHLKTALARNPDDAYNLSRLGYLEFQQEKYDDALDSLGRAAKLDPQNPEIENYLGVTLSHKGLRVQAETALRKAIQLDPNYAAAHNNLAVIYISQQPPLVQLARWHYQKALDAGQPHNPELEKALDQAVPPPNPQ
jgi:tetratricopeptide (TPR) repeat protein